MPESKFLERGEEMNSMKAGNKIAVMTSALLLLACGFLYSGKTVSAAAEGKITGTVKLDGVAPHMRGIDMSKDPFCSKAHANDPAHLSEGLTGSALTDVPTSVPVFDQK
jgi:hypothetical protein